MLEWPDLKLPPINLYSLPHSPNYYKPKDTMADKQALADITVFNKYARFNHDVNRRENWKEITTRNKGMHIEKYPHMKVMVEKIYSAFVETKKVLPSMRSLQFGGRPILMAENRIFNCAYAPAESIDCAPTTSAHRSVPPHASGLPCATRTGQCQF